MIAIIDYGVGNLFSLSCSLKAVGVDVVVTGEADVIRKADKLILPGVGAFEDAAKKLFSSGLDKVVLEEVKKGKPLMGICLGMQMLFEKSYEYGEHKGLGLIKGDIVSMEGRIPKELNIPHIGWNALSFKKDSVLFKYINEGECVYFVHSYYACDCDSSVTATAEYGIDITACVESGNIFGCQFHPEKSGETGLKILKAFCETGEQK
ncbi:MAG: imidazole glycerol phosphate synthase subunit HisH [Ruminococcaceae bacterium]|nr:imidazole glycerol phosphate synthase subunit HisH [Oscillospiraceae bacterium]